MINFAYTHLEQTGDNAWTIGGEPLPKEASYIWHYWIPSLIAMNQHRYRMRSVDDVVATGAPFIYPLELRWEFIECLMRGAAPDFLTPHVPAVVRESARNGRAIIMLFFGHEGRPMIFSRVADNVKASVYDAIHDFVRCHDLPPEVVWFLQANLDGEREYADWQKARAIDSARPPFETRLIDLYSYMTQSLRHLHETGKDVSLKWDMCGSEYGVSHIAAHVSLQPLGKSLGEAYATVPDGTSDVMPDKLFLCMNRITRPHRRSIVCFLQSQGYLDQSLVSFRDDIPDGNHFDDQNLQKAWEEIKKKQPLEIDRANMRSIYDYGNKPAQIDEFSPANLGEAWPYRQTFFNLVNETHFTSNVQFVSEKIWKPIINGQPFIVTGTPGSLVYLHKLGFKTFSPFVDESYDSVTDDMARMKCIFASIEKLGQLSQAQHIKMRRDMQPVLQHNLQHLRTMVTPMEKTIHEMAAKLQLDKKRSA